MSLWRSELGYRSRTMPLLDPGGIAQRGLEHQNWFLGNQPHCRLSASAASNSSIAQAWSGSKFRRSASVPWSFPEYLLPPEAPCSSEEVERRRSDIAHSEVVWHGRGVWDSRNGEPGAPV